MLLCYKKFRCEQGSNLRGKTPLDFKSNALTTRPSQLWYLIMISTLISIFQDSLFNPKQVGLSFATIVLCGVLKYVIKRYRSEQELKLLDLIQLDFAGRLIHRANPAHDFLYAFVLVSLSLSLVMICILFPFLRFCLKYLVTVSQKDSLRAGFEPVVLWEDPIRSNFKFFCFGYFVLITRNDRYSFFRSFASILLLCTKRFAASRVRTCAGRPHWISSPTP